MAFQLEICLFLMTCVQLEKMMTSLLGCCATSYVEVFAKLAVAGSDNRKWWTVKTLEPLVGTLGMSEARTHSLLGWLDHSLATHDVFVRRSFEP